MADLITKYGIGDYSYDFTQTHLEQVEAPSGFGDLIPQNVRLLGMSGGYNGDGRDGARSEIGNVQAFFNVISDGTEADMSQKIRALYGMQAWGEKRLFKTFGDGIQAWTWATINNIRASDRSDNLSYLVRQVQINWSCPKSRWYSKPDMTFFETG